MNTIADHLEYLLRRHDCVVLPGVGAFLCNYAPAHFDAGQENVLNPPGRVLVFNGMLSESDGLLAASIARKEKISYEAAARIMNDEVELLRRQLNDLGEYQLGRLGRLISGAEGEVGFKSEYLPSINGYLYGLKPIAPVSLVSKELQSEKGDYAESESAIMAETVHTYRLSGWRAYATGIAAMLAVIVTAGMFLISPIQVDQPTQTASIAPVPAANIANETKIEKVKKQVVAVEKNTTSVVAASKQEAFEKKQINKTSTPVVAPVKTNTVPPKVVVCNENQSAPKEMTDNAQKNVQSQSAMRFDINDSYCVVVASFPTKAQADEYVNTHQLAKLGILEKDNKFRVYAATGKSYNEAITQRSLVKQADAWVCRR